jgi:hypothetical protein
MICITKTSAEARLEIENKGNGDCICPECKRPTIGLVARKEGIFKTQERNEFSCVKCGCEWATEWKRT